MGRLIALIGQGGIVLALLLSTSPVTAQTVAQTFDELRGNLKPGDTVWVTDETNQEIKGRIVDVLESALVLTTLSASSGSQGRREVPARNIIRVRQRHPDPLWNGAVIGAAIGLSPAIWWCAPQTESGEQCSGAFFLLAGALGAGAGAGIDALRQTPKTIYLRPGSSSAGLHVSPMLSPDVRGVRVSLLF